MQEGNTMVTPGYEQTEAGGGVAMTTGSNEQGGGFGQPDQAQFEADKRSVYKHPLFPLLALLFERCEQATQSAECPNSESFNMDIQAFVQHQERDRKPFLLNDPEVDGLATCKCKYQCRDLSKEQMELLFTDLHKLTDEQQGTYLMNRIEVTNVARRRHGTYSRYSN